MSLPPPFCSDVRLRTMMTPERTLRSSSRMSRRPPPNASRTRSASPSWPRRRARPLAVSRAAVSPETPAPAWRARARVWAPVRSRSAMVRARVRRRTPVTEQSAGLRTPAPRRSARTANVWRRPRSRAGTGTPVLTTAAIRPRVAPSSTTLPPATTGTRARPAMPAPTASAPRVRRLANVSRTPIAPERTPTCVTVASSAGPTRSASTMTVAQ